MVSLSPDTLTEKEVLDLAIAGLTPAKYHKFTGSVQLAAIRRILPSGHRRTETAKLIVSTIELLGPQSAKQLRAIWYTGLAPGGEMLDLNDQTLQDHAVRWAVFQARQIQRYILESLLCCLERVVDKGIRSVTEIVDALFSAWPGTVPATLLNIMDEELGQPDLKTDEQATAWCSTVGPDIGAALSWLREGETILDVDKVRILQHGLPPLLCSMVVLALVLLVVGELLVSQNGTCLGCQLG